jgi:hypothetical protein
MSSERLARGRAEIQRSLDEGKHPGAVSPVVRNGKIVDWAAYGKGDVDAGFPMEKDTIVRIYSMSKIVTRPSSRACVQRPERAPGPGLDSPPSGRYGQPNLTPETSGGFGSCQAIPLARLTLRR